MSHSNSRAGASSKAAAQAQDKEHKKSNNTKLHSNAREDPSQATKMDYAIAKYLRNELPVKEAKFLGIKQVNYFIGSKAVDALLTSQWAPDLFPSGRKDATLYLNDMLIKKFFHRAKKIVKMDGEKKKFKLDMHHFQEFEDVKQPFVWLYEPTSVSAWLLSIGVIFAVIAICLFPLWPSFLRTWIYYTCIAGLVALSLILAIAVARHIIFAFIWALTFGKVHFWLLPNLTEDVGFVESFWPLYMFDNEEGGDGEADENVKDSSSSADNPEASDGDGAGSSLPTTTKPATVIEDSGKAHQE